MFFHWLSFRICMYMWRVKCKMMQNLKAKMIEKTRFFCKYTQFSNPSKSLKMGLNHVLSSGNIPSDIFNPNPETQKIHLKTLENIQIFRVRCHFFTRIKTLKIDILTKYVDERVGWWIWHVGKKTCDRSIYSPKILKKSKKSHENIQS